MRGLAAPGAPAAAPRLVSLYVHGSHRCRGSPVERFKVCVLINMELDLFRFGGTNYKVSMSNRSSASGTGTDGTDDGNTLESSVGYKGRAFFITWNNYKEVELEQWNKWLDDNCEENSWQREIGANGTPHIQGCFRFKNPRSWNAVRKELVKFAPTIHIEACRNYAKSASYCTKQNTRDDGGSSIGKTKGISISKDPMECLEIQWWQTEIEDVIKGPAHDRRIHWYFDIKGGAGKTTFCRSLLYRFPNEVIYLSGKAADVKCGVAQFVMNKGSPRICIFDCVRSTEGYVSYEAFEAVKNGIFFSGKYESGMIAFDIPHVFIFANFEPDITKLSTDRWYIRDINDSRSYADVD